MLLSRFTCRERKYLYGSRRHLSKARRFSSYRRGSRQLLTALCSVTSQLLFGSARLGLTGAPLATAGLFLASGSSPRSALVAPLGWRRRVVGDQTVPAEIDAHRAAGHCGELDPHGPEAPPAEIARLA